MNFNNAIKNTKPKNRSLAPDNAAGLPSFSYKLGNRGWKNKFVKNYFTNVEEEGEEEQEQQQQDEE